jgi:hypothetical protein
MPPAAKTLFEKRVLDSQKLFINKKFLWGVQMLHGAVFIKRAPLAAGGLDIKEKIVASCCCAYLSVISCFTGDDC